MTTIILAVALSVTASWLWLAWSLPRTQVREDLDGGSDRWMDNLTENRHGQPHPR